MARAARKGGWEGYRKGRTRRALVMGTEDVVRKGINKKVMGSL